jgi:ADP-ribose pyrophosphatase
MFDQIRSLPVAQRSVEYRGKIWAIIKETFHLGDQVVTRDYLQHMGAVAVLAINEKDEVLTIHQYRHPVGANLVEIPAGLLDFPDESPIEAAKRELLEETGYSAQEWFTLCDFCTTPGSSSEAVRIFLAKNLTFEGFDATTLDAEETELEPKWIKISELIDFISQGHLSSPTAVLAITTFVTLGDRTLRAPNAPWPLRDNLVATNRLFEQ